MAYDWKSVAIGILAAFLVLDFMYSFSKRNSPHVLEKAVDSMSSSSGFVAILASLMIGALVWYLSSRPSNPKDKEKYGIKN
jgi:hypothetical protein